MTDKDDAIHIEDDDARAAETTGAMRYVLGISLVLAAAAMTIAWVSGALSQGDVESEATVTGTNEAQADGDTAKALPNAGEVPEPTEDAEPVFEASESSEAVEASE